MIFLFRLLLIAWGLGPDPAGFGPLSLPSRLVRLITSHRCEVINAGRRSEP